MEPEASNASTPCLEAARLRHFLYLGLEGNCYHTGKNTYVLNNINCLNTLLETQEGGMLVLETAFQVAKGPHLFREPILFAIAACTRSKYPAVKNRAYETLYDLSLTALELFAFIRYAEEVSRPSTGWGRSRRRLVDNWYNGKSPKKLAEETTRVVSRHRWKHRDLLLLAHVTPLTPGVAVVLAYLTKGIDAATTEAEKHNSPETTDVLEYLKTVHVVKHITDEHALSRFVEIQELSFEHIPTQMLKSKEVWTCLIPRIPIKTLLLQLPRLHRITLLKPNSVISKLIVDRIVHQLAQQNHNLGPLEVFMIVKLCEETARLVSPNKTLPVNAANACPPRHRKSPLDDALQSLFYDTFKNLQSTSKRFLIAVDVRNTMVHKKISGCTNLTPADATALLVMALTRAEQAGVTAVAFSMRGMVTIDINNKMNLHDISRRMRETPMGPLNLSAPLAWALEHKKAFDVILICTDNQTQIGDVHPAEALKEYRITMKLPQTKMIVCAMTSPGFAIAPPEEFGMFDIAGFDQNVLQIIQDFARGVF